MKEQSISDTTLKFNYCINCGICKAVCPHSAIVLKKNKYGENIPCIDQNKCTKCGICSLYCPNTKEKLVNTSRKIALLSDKRTYGLFCENGENAEYLLAYSKNDTQRIKSCSGGALTEIACSLLKSNIIDGVVHVKRLWSKRGDSHYCSIISYNENDIREHVSSAYEPIDFSDVLSQIQSGKKYFIVATPCVISGLKKLFEKHSKYKKSKIITCALICSHNVTPQFADYFCDLHNIPLNVEYKINFRNKDNVPNQANFNSHIYSQEKDLLKSNRYNNGWTDLWRSYAFSMNVCSHCCDFWGYEADLSVKDAWGKWTDFDSKGKSILVVRNKSLLKHIEKSNLVLQKLQYDVMKGHQYETSIYKQRESLNKNTKLVFSIPNIKNTFFKKYLMTICSKYLYANLGFRSTYNFFFIVKKLHNLSDILKKNFIYIHLKGLFSSISKVFSYNWLDKRPDTFKSILVLGGYGYGNTGDEAQCAATLELLTNRYKNYQILNLTPSVNYSIKIHPAFHHDLASRCAFFSANKTTTVYGDSYPQLILFGFKSLLILLNSFLVRANLPTLLCSPSSVKLMVQMKNSSLIYFCGGGFLTGDTLSRLLDGIIFCKIAKILGVPVVMSGQTIGRFKNFAVKKLAHWGFKDVNLITTRDKSYSLNDLKEIGISGDNVFETHDDALYCEKSYNYDFNIDGKYAVVNFHFWGMNNEKKDEIIGKINKIVSFILEKYSSLTLVFIPMHETDVESYNYYISKYSSNRFCLFKYDYDFRKVRGVISKSEFCLTMKHHPIIFSVGENIPVISMVYSNYYLHKNLGALGQYGLQDFSINFEDELYFEKFMNIFETLMSDKQRIIDLIKNSKLELSKNKTLFLNKVDELLKKYQ